MSDEAIRVGRRDLLREAIRAEKRRMLARVLGETGSERQRLLKEIAAANELITWFDARRIVH
jgi:hypothetical protein